MLDNWEELEKSIQDCKKCKNCSKVNIGYGNNKAEMMVISFKALKDNEKEILNNALIGNDIDLNNMYFTSLIKCENDVDNIQEIINSCLDYLRNQVILIKPKKIILLGQEITNCILGANTDISNIRGKGYIKKGITYIPTYDIITIIEKEELKIKFWNDIKLVNLH